MSSFSSQTGHGAKLELQIVLTTFQISIVRPRIYSRSEIIPVYTEVIFKPLPYVIRPIKKIYQQEQPTNLT